LIAVFDLDGTLLKKNSSFAFCRFLCKQGFISHRDLTFCSYIYLRHCYFGLSLWDLHALTFDRLFRGVSLASLQAFIRAFTAEHLEALWYQPALSRLKSIQQEGADCVILSNSPRFLVAEIAKKINIESVYATEYHINDSAKLTSLASLMDGSKKASLMQQWVKKRTIAFSDSPLDLPFLEAATIKVAVNPKRALKKIAKARGWEIL
jgi:HAD superfamily hydrolase (TIGR01490 family)